jgi:hypothetical protein
LSLFPDLIFFEYVFWAMDAQTQMQTEWQYLFFKETLNSTNN